MLNTKQIHRFWHVNLIFFLSNTLTQKPNGELISDTGTFGRTRVEKL